MESITDNALMLKVKSGDVDKLGLLYERYNKILFGFFYRLTSNSATSEDLVQNVFMRILRYRDKFRNEGKFSTWMFSIAHNISADHFKKTKRRGYTEDIDELEVRDDCDLDEKIIKDEEKNILNKALDQLSKEYKEVIVLSRFHDLKYKEIAEILNTTESNVKIRVFRAIKELKSILIKMEN